MEIKLEGSSVAEAVERSSFDFENSTKNLSWSPERF